MEKLNKKRWKINKFYYLFFKERFNKEIEFNFPKTIYRWDLVNKIINHYKYLSYLEIGCDDDYLFSKVRIENKIGVDPYSGGNFKGTSDAFFQQNNKIFDCIFIDGLHEFDQVNKDITNSLDCLSENGIILLHDCLPKNLGQQAIPRYQLVWNGDVWKSIVKFRCRPNLDIVTCMIDHGVAVIRKKKNNKLLTLDLKNFKKLKFKDFYYNHKEYMRILDYEELFRYLK